MGSSLTREQILKVLQDALEPQAYIYAFWEAGSRATGLADQWSDLDLQVVVEDGKVAEAVALAEQALASLSPTELRFEVPRPTWHGHWQCFYKLADASPYLLVDLCVMEAGNPSRFLEPEIHGTPVVFFDKQVFTEQQPTEAQPLAERLRQRVAMHATLVEIMHTFVDKELLRGRYVDAFSYYHGLLLTRLVELLRMRYSPWRYNFGYRYLDRDLPTEMQREVQALLFVAGPEELAAKKARVVELIRETVRVLHGVDQAVELERTRAW